MPFVIAVFAIVHLLFLHSTGSSNPLGLSFNIDKVSFRPYFRVKDLLGVIFFFLGFSLICFFYPWVLGDPENFIPANPIVTPVHIQPE
jgi:ubiquinol-cytochrome c reductase cytochrome b subunit